MGLFGPSKQEQEMQLEINRLRAMLPPQAGVVIDLQKQIDGLNEMKLSVQNECYNLQQQVSNLSFQRQQLENEIVNIQSEIDIQDYGFYTPTYKFANSDLYKDRLKAVRDSQKDLIKRGLACDGNMNWSVNGNITQGKKMVKDMQKLLLRAFNVECDNIVDNVKISNFDKSKERINKVAEQISKLGTIMSIYITPMYINLKIEELCLALDFEQKKQEEKERIKEARERQREEARIQKEIEEERKKLLKEQTHYQNALSVINEQLQQHPDDIDLLTRQRELQANIADTERAITNVDYREANKRAGYVYIISNIGAFGENVYKIGMTRRLEPMDRVNELGDASVPFNFDVHALIFSDDAPTLETALHHAFDDKKVNKVNSRREFFRVSLDEIKREVRKNFDKTVEWVDFPEAEQFRQSMQGGNINTYINEISPTPQTTTSVSNTQTNTSAINTNNNRIVKNNPTIRQSVSPAQTVAQPQQKQQTDSLFLVKQLKNIIASYNYQCKEEDTPDFLRLHIYNLNGQKLGIAKIAKPDMNSIQFKKLGNPVPYEISSVEEIKNYL